MSATYSTGTPGSNLNYLNAITPQVERSYLDAREAFVNAAADLTRHGQRFAKRANEAGGSVGFTAPMAVELVTKDEIVAAIEARA